MTRIKHLRKFFGYTQDALAQLLHVSRSTVAMWEVSTQEPDHDTLKKISQIFDVPPDYVVNKGIFSDWDNVLKYYDFVSYELIKMIPGTLKMPSYCSDKFLIAWLDTRLYGEPDELQLARWFDFAIKDICITPNELYKSDSSVDPVNVDCEFTSAFNALINAETQNRSDMASGMSIPVLGDVAAGIPIEAITDIVDYEEIDATLAKSGDFFGLRIKGASMEPRMREGDVVIVRKQDTAESGETVVVLVNGDSATVKKIKYGPDGITLLPTNPSFDPIFYSASEVEALPVRVIGKVVELRAKY